MTVKTVRVEARFPPDVKALAERAALASGSTLTDYLANLVRQDAPARLKSLSEIQLTNEQFDNFLRACERAPSPSEKLMKIARKLDQEGL